MGLFRLILFAIIVYLLYRSLRNIIRDAFGLSFGSKKQQNRHSHGFTQEGTNFAQGGAGFSQTTSGSSRKKQREDDYADAPIGKDEGEYVEFEELER